MFDYNELAKQIHAQNVAVGWWDNPNPCTYEKLQLVSTEIAEATEGERTGAKDSHLPHRKVGEVGLADALIRLLDLGGRYGWEWSAPQYMCKTLLEIQSIGGKHAMLTCQLGDLILSVRYKSTHAVSMCYSDLINSIILVADLQGYDINGAMLEKIEYNRHRADHKREARNQPGGKGF